MSKKGYALYTSCKQRKSGKIVKDIMLYPNETKNSKKITNTFYELVQIRNIQVFESID